MQEVVANLLKTHEQDQEEIKTMKQVISNSEEEHKKDVENVRVQKNKELVELEVSLLRNIEVTFWLMYVVTGSLESDQKNEGEEFQS